jgi:hypothetical protein
MFLNVNPDVFSVGFRRIDPPVQSSLEQEDLEGGNPTTDAGNEKHYRGEYCKQVPQDIDKKAKSDEQQPYDEKSGCEVSGGLRNGVGIEAKIHFSILDS